MNGRAGRGTKLFERSEAQKLADELNDEYPQIDHEVAEVETTESERGSSGEKVGSHRQSSESRGLHAVSVR